MEKKEILKSSVEFFALCGAIAFVCGFADVWSFLACFIFVAISATLYLIHSAY